MSRALLITGGLGHPPAASVDALRALGADADISLDVHEDVDAGLDALGDGHALLVVNALAFSMAHPRYDEIRGAEAYTLSDRGAATIERWHRAGRPVLALHTAVICFDTWAGWSDLLGARWDWARSFHPPLGPCRVRVGDHEVDLRDEAYRDLRLASGNDVVAWTVVDGVEQEAAWTRERAGGGRVAVDLLGHDERSLRHPVHVGLLQGLLRWSLGRTDTFGLDLEETHP